MSCTTRDRIDGTIGVSGFVSCSTRRLEVDGLGLWFSWPAASRRRRFWPSLTSEKQKKKKDAQGRDKVDKNYYEGIFELTEAQSIKMLQRNKPDGKKTLSSESDRGALCLFKLALE